MLNHRDIAAVTKALVDTETYQAVKYVSEKFVVRATKPRYRHQKKQWDKRDNRVSLIVTFGAPNYLERAFIANCKRAGEPLPVRKIQLRDFPKVR